MLHSLLVSVSGDDTGSEAPSPSQWRRLISVLGAKTGCGLPVLASAGKVACLSVHGLGLLVFALIQLGSKRRLPSFTWGVWGCKMKPTSVAIVT